MRDSDFLHAEWVKRVETRYVGSEIRLILPGVCPCGSCRWSVGAEKNEPSNHARDI